MLFNASEIQAASCSMEERAAAARLVDTMGEMAGKAAKEGLFALDLYQTEQAGFLGEAVGIVIEGSDGSGKDLREAALAGGKKGRELLERLMIAQGLKGIADGEGPSIIRLKVKAYAGQEVCFGETRE